MSSPYNDTGRPATLTVGGGPILLTPGAAGDPPLVIVNTSKDRAWIAGDSTVSSNNGVPLDPGTSLPWTGTGEVWGVADDAATAPIVVYITSAISGWTPSPAAIAAQVAAELLATGIPNVLTETVVADDASIAVGAHQDFDVSGFASVNVVTTADPASYAFLVDFPSLGPVIVDEDILPTGRAVRMAVVAPTLRIYNTQGATHQIGVSIVGSNRAALTRLDGRTVQADAVTFTRAVSSPAAGGVYALTQDNTDAVFQGQYFADVQIQTTGSSTVAGQFVATNIVGDETIVLVDTTQMGALTRQGQGSGAKSYRGMIALPLTFNQISFVSSAGAIGTYTFQVVLTAAGPV